MFHTVGQCRPNSGSTPRAGWAVLRNFVSTVYEAGPTLKQHLLNASCLLGCHPSQHRTLNQCYLNFCFIVSIFYSGRPVVKMGGGGPWLSRSHITTTSRFK